MATAPTYPQRKNRETSLPPKRGQVKAQIFESMAKTVVSAFKAFVGNKGEGSDGKSSSSATTTPPESGYNSAGNGDIS
ncbi:hypothetical protein COLO4_18387 [Corchorus olitorius]|uniref:Uncharacterized protein n=1 Tax=Corchorus olitorius TaxID=93759 RepID=A0A1R3J9G8_9ROSI|nr:hypothetical protein COLO4_18387 [Corchorus olitorius]